jgi:hypothetical protein
MNRDIRITISLTRWQFERIAYLADLVGERPATWLANEVQRNLDSVFATGTEEAKLFDQISKLRRKAQGQIALPIAAEEKK